MLWRKLRRKILLCLEPYSGHPFFVCCQQVEAGHAAIGTEPAAVLFEQFPVDFSVVVHHPQPTLDGKVVVAEHVGPLHTEEQYHLCRPDTDAFQAAQLPDGLIVRPLPDTLEVKFSALDFPGKVRNVFSLSEGHTEALQLLNPGSEDGSCIHFPLDVSHLCDDRRHPLVSCAQIRRFRFAVLEIHLSRLLSIQPFVCSSVVDLIITERTKFCNIKAPCQKAER